MKKEVNFRQRAIYYQSGEIGSATKEVWFVLHGYGQLPQYFIRKFRHIVDTDRVVIAPGGLSRFYLEGFSGRVGGTWMTSEERLIDIENYISYLNEVAFQVLSNTHKNIKISVLGFSQGSATACRWVEHFNRPLDKLILHSGAFPPDIDYSGLSSRLKGADVFMIRGDNDEFVNEKRRKEQEELIRKLDIDIKHINFHGGHDIDNESLLRIIGQ